MEALRQYLKEMPHLPDLVLEYLGGAMDKGLFDHNNADELRLAYKEAQQLANEKLLDTQRPYYVITFPQVKVRCPSCYKEVPGGFYEISNPITHARGMLRARLMHEFLEHGRTGYFEPIVNMSEVHMGEDEHDLDLKKLKKLLAGLEVPAEVLADLEAGLAEGLPA